MSKPTSLMWFRRDLRIADNPALEAAVQSGLPLLCVYVDAESGESPWPAGGALNVVLASALGHLDVELKKRGSHLHVLRLKQETDLLEFCAAEQVREVFWNRRYDRYGVEVDSRLKREMQSAGMVVTTCKGSVLCEPFEVKQASGKPYQVYTPFFKVIEKALALQTIHAPPENICSARPVAPAEKVEAHRERWLPKLGWDREIKMRWEMSETQALARLNHFLDQEVRGYKERRDYLADEKGTSHLSPYLALGVISPRQIFWHIGKRQEGVFSVHPGIYQYQKEVIWREFAQHLLCHFPHTDLAPLRESFKNFPWEDNLIHLTAWQRGQTGYPVVDAAMRELWTTGWMHNRSRMIVASFLVKHLRLHWLHGAKWFWDTLVDADLANNTLGWQWSAGCGADAAPYFRIFNPVLQGEKFDAEGGYIRRWVPELATLGNEWIHRPWEAPSEVMRTAGIRLGEHYPHPIVDHRTERELALRAFKQISAKV